MNTDPLTDKQRQALEPVEQARSQSMNLSAVGQGLGISVRATYDGLAVPAGHARASGSSEPVTVTLIGATEAATEAPAGLWMTLDDAYFSQFA